MPQPFEIDTSRFNNEAYLAGRIAQAQDADKGSLSTALKYLYTDQGPLNLPRARLKQAEPYLDAAERVVVRWLATRTNGSGRGDYGKEALRAARASRYRCSRCDFADVRALNLDHVDGRTAGTTFACLCANCHSIKSRKMDWSGRKRETSG